MAKSRLFKTKLPPSSLAPQDTLTALVKAKKYRQAIALLEKIKQGEPEVVVSPSEAEIWLLKGEEELATRLFKAAESSFRQAISLGMGGKAYYGAARALLALKRLDAAIALLQEGFTNQQLTAQFNLCYAKLLLIKGDTEAVKTLLASHRKSFKPAEIHWLRGVLALYQEDYSTSLEHFQKVNAPLTPGDDPLIWPVYARQKLEQWPEAQQLLHSSLERTTSSKFLFQPHRSHPVLQRLELWQCLQTQGLPKLSVSHGEPLLEGLEGASILALSFGAEDYLRAGLAYFTLDNHIQRWPEIQALRTNLLLMAGQQAYQQHRLEMALDLWLPLSNDRDFHLQLFINLIDLLEEQEEFKDRQRLLVRLIKWLGEKGKKEPQQFPPELLGQILAYAHCISADSLMVMGKVSMALGELQRAERLCPDSPEVWARKGIIEYMEDNYEEATRLLTQALAGGSCYGEGYKYLLESLSKLDRQTELEAVRSRFGGRFGDRSSEKSDIATWELALGSRSFELFDALIEGEEEEGPLMACQIFAQHTRGAITSGGKISLDQEGARRQWDEHLAQLKPFIQAQTLTAIALCLHLFGKKEKGIAALLQGYLQQLAHWGSQIPAAQEGYLMLMLLRATKPNSLDPLIKTYLDSQPEPVSALARLQLRLRFFTAPKQQALLRPHLEMAYQKEPQNPLLLLAIATTHKLDSPDYQKYQQESFEIARRLQDAEALQACRCESEFSSFRDKQDLILELGTFSRGNMEGMEKLVEKLAERMLGGKIPPEEIREHLPELIEMLMGGEE